MSVGPRSLSEKKVNQVDCLSLGQKSISIHFFMHLLFQIFQDHIFPAKISHREGPSHHHLAKSMKKIASAVCSHGPTRFCHHQNTNYSPPKKESGCGSFKWPICWTALPPPLVGGTLVSWQVRGPATITAFKKSCKSQASHANL